MTDLSTSWQNAQIDIKEQIGESSYQQWFAHVHARTQDNSRLFLEVPDEFFKNWISDRFLQHITGALEKQGRGDVSVEIVVSAVPFTPVTLEIPKTAGPAPAGSRPVTPTRAANLNSQFTFDTFVIGQSNRFAAAAGQRVADEPAKTYNPLFIYGQSGLGKTHLIQSIANHILQKKPHLSCCYLTSETFTNELIEAIRFRSANDFRQRYRNIDILLIDDIHFIAGKESTQEEFFHTFNTLHNNHKQLIFTSDRPPREIPDLQERLVTRFSMGLIADIQPPDYETRVAILRKKVDMAGVRIPDDVIYFIAENIKTNIRELEGTLIRVFAKSRIEDQPITLEMTRMVLKDLLKESVKIISIEMVQQAVIDHFRLSLNDLRSSKKTQNIAVPRQIAMYLTRRFTKHSLPEIGNAFGGKDHTTVLHACKKIEERIHSNNEMKYIIEKLTTVLNT
ncbi:MAG: chromosomal replication initiator protein DnaA [Elusimicrobia bacterium]|nr:chromosomal replication initiator protein DnaA [Elusimicrobiota bacterium]